MAGWMTLMVVIAVAGRVADRELSVFQRLPQHVLPKAVHYAAPYGRFVALTLIPLAQVGSIEFTMPIWSTALALAFLREHMNCRNRFVVLLVLVGVAVIARPGAGELAVGLRSRWPPRRGSRSRSCWSSRSPSP